jgi:hypothetical protein
VTGALPARCGVIHAHANQGAAGEGAHKRLYRERMSNMSNFEIVQQQQHVHNPDIRKVLISLS